MPLLNEVKNDKLKFELPIQFFAEPKLDEDGNPIVDPPADPNAGDAVYSKAEVTEMIKTEVGKVTGKYKSQLEQLESKLSGQPKAPEEPPVDPTTAQLELLKTQVSTLSTFNNQLIVDNKKALVRSYLKDNGYAEDATDFIYSSIDFEDEALDIDTALTTALAGKDYLKVTPTKPTGATGVDRLTNPPAGGTGATVDDQIKAAQAYLNKRNIGGQ